MKPPPTGSLNIDSEKQYEGTSSQSQKKEDSSTASPPARRKGRRFAPAALAAPLTRPDGMRGGEVFSPSTGKQE